MVNLRKDLMKDLYTDDVELLANQRKSLLVLLFVGNDACWETASVCRALHLEQVFLRP